MSLQDTFDLLMVLSRVLDNELHHGSVVKIMRVNLQPFASKGLLLISAVQNVRHVVTGLGMVVDVQRVKAQCETCISALQRQARARRGPNDDEEIPPEDFTELPIFPSVRDMDWTEDHFLRANKQAGAFRDVHHYLDVQFRLLREDYIRPLRNGIREYQEKRQRNEATGQIQDVRLYYQVQILELVCDQHLEHRLQFDNTQFQNMRWQSSKRLIYGSLVCLSHDDFKTIYFAVVTNRDVKDLENGIIQVKFENCLEKILELSGNEVFTMAECVTFFEAHRHVLKGMQEMAQNQRGFPMSQYIVECRSEVAPPKYLKTADGRVYTMDLKSIMRNGNNPSSHHVNVLRPSSWPSLADTPFNQSQLDAVKTALTKELAIIQGPPGTGKTYVGLKIAKVLLDNRGVWNEPDNPRPILVVCYTNHALDQFLEGILKFQSKGIVRVGGQSKSEELKGLNLKLIKEKKRRDKQVNLSTRNSIKDCYRERDGIREQLEKASAKLEATRRGVVRENVLTSHMHPNHRSSLKRQTYGYRQRSVMVEWLTAGAAVAVDDAEECRRLKQEITAKILNGEGTMDDETTNPDNVLGLPFAERAKLYR
nr:hypothetical protein BaRGS_017890 [Batillaria attramentaria]